MKNKCLQQQKPSNQHCKVASKMSSLSPPQDLGVPAPSQRQPCTGKHLCNGVVSHDTQVCECEFVRSRDTRVSECESVSASLQATFPCLASYILYLPKWQ